MDNEDEEAEWRDEEKVEAATAAAAAPCLFLLPRGIVFVLFFYSFTIEDSLTSARPLQDRQAA